MGLSRQADVLARLGAIGGIYGIDLAPLEDALGKLAPQLARGTLVTVPIMFDRLTCATAAISLPTVRSWWASVSAPLRSTACAHAPTSSGFRRRSRIASSAGRTRGS